MNKYIALTISTVHHDQNPSYQMGLAMSIESRLRTKIDQILR